MAVVTETTDAPENDTTPYEIVVGDSFQGTLSPTGERDWIAIDLVEGDLVSFTLTGGSLSDPYLRIYDSTGALVDYNDDFGEGLDSFLTLAVESTETYYIEVASWSDDGSGSYTLETAVAPPPDPLEAIDWGTQLPDNEVTYYFAPNGVTADGVTSEGYNAYEMARFEAAFAMIATYTNLTFTEVNSAAAADFTFVLDTNELPSNLYGYMNPPGEPNPGVGVFNGNNWDRSAGGSLDLGGDGFFTVIHELGHGLGLAHPHDTGGTSEVMTGVDGSSDTGTFSLNQGIFTVMSYNSSFVEGPVGTPAPDTNSGSMGSFMAFDIALLQQKYGANPNTGSGNTVYTLDDDTSYWLAIYDVGGTDTIVNDSNTAATIDLRAASLLFEAGGGGFASAIDGIAGGFTIANGTVIENATGGAAGDTLSGNAIANVLVGLAGNDTIFGRRGHDTISGGTGNDSIDAGLGNDIVAGGIGADDMDGGAGRDTLTYAASGAAVNIRLGSSNNTGGDAEGDIITSFERVVGSDFNDVMRAMDLAGTTLEGGDGNDRLYGGMNAQVLRGEAGNDTITGYGGPNINQSGIGDVIDGGFGNDILAGSAGADTIIGGFGNDIIAGNANDDSLVGNNGKDTVTYANSDAGVNVLLNSASNSGGHAAGDILEGFERVVGSDFDDTIAANNVNAATIEGGAGNDRIIGGGNFQSLRGGGGNDTITGYSGADPSSSSVRDIIVGDVGNDVLAGAGGDDTIDGGTGNDLIRGNAGDDILNGGTGFDTFIFGLTSETDTILDFQDDIDTLRLEQAIWGGGLTAQEVVNTFAVDTSGDTVFDFGSGLVVVVENMADRQDMVDDLSFA
ncbi:peptidase domain protein [Citreicella sp. SE45]|nr:peptidase domain protein [Citreicella sp. SE45]